MPPFDVPAADRAPAAAPAVCLRGDDASAAAFPPWSELYAHRKAMAARFGKQVFQLPLRRRVRQVLLERLRDGQRVLEVGAGERKMAREVRSALLDGQAFTFTEASLWPA